MGILIDTNVLSELHKGARCDPHVTDWYAGVSESDIYVSVIVLGEIRRGTELLPFKTGSFPVALFAPSQKPFVAVT